MVFLIIIPNTLVQFFSFLFKIYFFCLLLSYNKVKAKDAITQEVFENYPQSTLSSMQKRQDLVRMVLHERKLIAMVARRLSLKLPTARLIINKFLKTGTFTVKKAERTAEAVQPESPEPENNAVSEERLEVEPVNQNHFGDVNQ